MNSRHELRRRSPDGRRITPARQTTRPRSAQGRILRRRVLARMIGGILAYSVVFALGMAAAEEWVVPRVAALVADNAGWHGMPADEYAQALVEGLLPESAYGTLYGQGTVSDGALAEGNTAGETTPGGSGNPSGDDGLPNDLGAVISPDVIRQADGSYLVRNVGPYNFLRAAKVPAALALYFAGVIAIVIASLNYAVTRFEALSATVTDLLADRSAPIALPNDLDIVRDELARIQRESLAAEQAARTAEQRKNELVAYLAHDIRTPLTSVLGYLELLREPEHLADKDRRAFASIAAEKAGRLEGLVEEFFEITRYNLQAIPIERQRVDVRLLCEQVADELYPQAQARGLRVRVAAPEEGLPGFVDPDKLARALSNVVRNAIAYADEGTEVLVEARPTGPEAPGDALEIRVVDRGREISPAHLERIFERFFREDGARGSQGGGAGLGLAIAREIIAAHGGTICAASEAGLTTFTTALPAAPH